jgi:hypothetical protein
MTIFQKNKLEEMNECIYQESINAINQSTTDGFVSEQDSY